nr:hypothetical protein Iba_chr04dCG10570 [Ipomoea batatas]
MMPFELCADENENDFYGVFFAFGPVFQFQVGFIVCREEEAVASNAHPGELSDNVSMDISLLNSELFDQNFARRMLVADEKSVNPIYC